MRVLKIIWEMFLSDFFCVKRPDGYPERPDVYSGCPDDTGSSFGLFGYRPDGRVFATVYVAQRPDVTYFSSER